MIMVDINIDIDKYKLPKNNYYRTAKKKTQIVVGNTFSNSMQHYNGWLTRCGGEYKETAAFTISAGGKIFQHYDPKYFSTFLSIKKANENIIPIVIENEGWLTKEGDKFYTWVGNEYGKPDSVLKRSWRNHEYWAPYNTKQLNALVRLIKYLSDKFSIPLQTIGHNTKVDDIYEYKGVVFRSNYLKHCTDLSPAWDYNIFKNKLEHYE